MKSSLLVIMSACLAAEPVSAGRPTAEQMSAARPNILLMVADDLGFADVGFMVGSNGSIVQSPALNQLALQGVRLSNHHVQPVCSPTRAALLTGRYVLRYGLQNTVIWPQDAFAVPANETFLSQNLKSAGYRTAILGKWHLGLYKAFALPMARGFDEQYGYYLGATDYISHRRTSGKSTGIDWHRNQSLAATGDDGKYSAGLIATAAIDFITRTGDRPWFLYLAWQSVHAPLEAPEGCIARYPSLSGTQRIRAAMASAMDDGVANITAALRRTGQLDQTLILFTADNGAPYENAAWEDDESEVAYAAAARAARPPAGQGWPPHGAGGGSNAPLSGWKHWLFEGGVRSAAFIWYAPLNERLGGKVHEGLFHVVDWLPTLVTLAGGSTARNLPLDGFDLWPALQQGGSASPRAELPVNIGACGPDANGTQTIISGPQAAIILGDFKLLVTCFWRTSRSLADAQLYNISADPSEENNLATSMPSIVETLGKRLAHWEALSVPPYAQDGIDPACGEGAPQGTPAAWNPWC